MRKNLIRFVGPLFVAGALIGVLASPSDAKDTNWPCHGCVRVIR